MKSLEHSAPKQSLLWRSRFQSISHEVPLRLSIRHRYIHLFVV